jgi:hypothetical protein
VAAADICGPACTSSPRSRSVECRRRWQWASGTLMFKADPQLRALATVSGNGTYRSIVMMQTENENVQWFAKLSACHVV